MQWALRLDEDRKMKAHQKKSFALIQIGAFLEYFDCVTCNPR